LRFQNFLEKLYARVLDLDLGLFLIAAAKPACVLILIGFIWTDSKKLLLAH